MRMGEIEYVCVCGCWGWGVNWEWKDGCGNHRHLLFFSSKTRICFKGTGTLLEQIVGMACTNSAILIMPCLKNQLAHGKEFLFLVVQPQPSRLFFTGPCQSEFKLYTAYRTEIVAAYI